LRNQRHCPKGEVFMIRFGLAAVIALVAPSMASATWINTNIENSGNTATLVGHGAINTSAWNTDFYAGSYNNTSVFLGNRFTYCVSTDQANSPSDAYNLTNITTVPLEYASIPQLANGIVYILQQTLGHQAVVGDLAYAVDASFRAAAQAAIWQVLHLWTGSAAVTLVTGDSVFTTTYANLMLVAGNLTIGPTNVDTGWGFGAGPPVGQESTLNQDMVWVNPPGTPRIVDEAPLPSSVYGLVGGIFACFAARRLFGIVA